MSDILDDYEDAIFDRGKIVEHIPIARLRELAEAEREGRVVVLPCKVGTTVYEAMTVVTWGYPDPNFGIRVVEKQFELSDTNAVGVSIFLTPEEAERRHALAAAEPKGEHHD